MVACETTTIYYYYYILLLTSPIANTFGIKVECSFNFTDRGMITVENHWKAESFD
jgi:hypothetical protein